MRDDTDHLTATGAGLPRLESFQLLPKLIFRDLMRTGSVSLQGPHRAGKTTLTTGFARLWEERGGKALLLDMRPLCWAEAPTSGVNREIGGVLPACRQALLERLGAANPADTTDHRFQLELSNLIERQPGKTLLVLDHWDELPGDIAQELLVALRAALQEQGSRRGGPGGVHLLLVGARDISETAPGVTSPIVNLPTVHWISDLSPVAARDHCSLCFRTQKFECESDAVDLLIDQIGGDRDLIGRAVARIAALAEARGTRHIGLNDVRAVGDSMLADVLRHPADWPLARELLAGLLSRRVLFDLMSALLAGRRTGLRDFPEETAAIEASGFVRRSGATYQFRTSFHESLARRLLTPRTWGDLAVLHHDWPQACGEYRAQGDGVVLDDGHFPLNALGMALATCLVRMNTIDDILHGLADMLNLSIRARNVAILSVRGRDPLHFRSVGEPPPTSADLLGQVERSVKLLESQVARVQHGQRWVLPLVVLGADRMPYTRWSVIFTSEADWPCPSVDEAKRLCLFAQQLLGQRLDSERDRSFAEITRSIDEAEGVEAILDRVARAALDLTAASFSSIEYAVQGELSTRAVRSNPPELEKRTNRQPTTPGQDGCGVTGYVYATGRPLIVGHRDLESENFESFRMLEGMRGALAEAAVPIVFKNQTYGVINVESEVPYFFANRDVLVLERLAALSGIAINTAYRLDRAEHDAIVANVFRGIAHEANNHSEGIALRVGLTLRSLDSGNCDEKTVRRSLGIIGDEARAISVMVDDFCWLARSNEQRRRFVISLQSVVIEALERLEDRLGRTVGDEPVPFLRELTTVEISDEVPLMVEGRPGLLRRVIENLLQNAWEAVLEHKSAEAGDVRIRLFRDENIAAVIEVTDRGAGFKDPIKIFQPFYTTKGAKGLGLGLAVVKQVVSAHCGLIEARAATYEPGSLFRLQLPLVKGVPAEAIEDD